MDKAVFEDMTDDELVDYASLVQWCNEKIGEGVYEMVVRGHTNLVVNTVAENFRKECWCVVVDYHDDKSMVLHFSPHVQHRQDNKPADYRTGIRPVSISEVS